MQTQRWLPSCHIAEAPGIGLPPWSAGQDRENKPGNALAASLTTPPAQTIPVVPPLPGKTPVCKQYSGFLPGFLLLPDTVPPIPYNYCFQESLSVKTLKSHAGLLTYEIWKRGTAHMAILNSHEDTIIFCPFLGKLRRNQEGNWSKYQLTRKMPHKERALSKQDDLRRVYLQRCYLYKGATYTKVWLRQPKGVV